MKITKFEDFEAWQQARKLANAVYDATDARTFTRDYGLKDQIRRASVSVMANIAEGFLYPTSKHFIKFLYIALASSAEVQSHLYMALDRKYISPKDFELLRAQTSRTAQIITGFVRYLSLHPRTKSPAGKRSTIND